MTKIPNFGNSRWRSAAILKIVLSLYISAGNHPIQMKFGMQMQIVVPRSILNKMLKFCQFKMADGRHIESRLLAISQRVIIGLKRNFVG